METVDELGVARIPREHVSSWQAGHSVDQVQGHEHRRQHCAALWDQREELRETYEVEHGSDQDDWAASRHPGIVLTAVPSIAHAACLGCQWLAQPGNSMSDEGWGKAAVTKVRTASFAVNRTSSSCRWGHPALMRATLGRVTYNRWRSSPWHI